MGLHLDGFYHRPPDIEGFNSVLVVVDRFTKMAHFIPCSKAISGMETTDLLLMNIVRLHGLPDDIISDRGPQFSLIFGNASSKLLELLQNFRQPSILRQTAKPNE